VAWTASYAGSRESDPLSEDFRNQCASNARFARIAECVDVGHAPPKLQQATGFALWPRMRSGSPRDMRSFRSDRGLTSLRFHSVSVVVGWVGRITLAGFAVVLGCVPRERPGQHREPPNAVETPSKSGASATPSPPVASTARAKEDALLVSEFKDDFDRDSSDVGPAWRSTSAAWSLSGGRLCGENAHNHPIWLARRLPKNASIEFQALSESPDGDIKAEFWGDGRSSASGLSYTDATSYLTIFGGWKNHFHVLARINEHAPDRQEVKLLPQGADFTRSTVLPHRAYQFHVERRDGRTVRWRVDDHEILNYADTQPLLGPGHEHFGFNYWEVRVCFDNLRVTPLQD
jgi:hypothetical protein